MKLRYLLISSGIIALGTSVAYAESAKDFVHDASVANQFEIESSKVALDKSKNKEVKSLARAMIEDHTKTGKKLDAVLKTSKSDLKPETSLDKKHLALVEMLKKAPENQFDKNYLKVQSDAHKEAVELFGEFAEDGKEPELKQFAIETLPTLKGHQTHVEQLLQTK